MVLRRLCIRLLKIEAPDAYGVSINRLDLAELKLSEEGGHLVQFYINNSGRD
jgi:hypothetical protein